MVRKNQKLKIIRGDTVKMLRGKDRGKIGKIIRVLPQTRTVVVEGMQIVKKFVKPRRQGEKAQQVQVPAAVPIAKVQLVCPHCQKPTRVALIEQNGKKVRTCKHCEALIAS